MVAAWPSSSNAITTAAAPSRRIARACARNDSSPSFRLIEFAIPFPWMHFRPATIAEKRELSTMIGTRAISGSVAITFRNVVIASSASRRSASMLTSIRFAPPLHLLERDRDGACEVAGLDQPAEPRGAGHVRALADHHEAGVAARSRTARGR